MFRKLCLLSIFSFFVLATSLEVLAAEGAHSSGGIQAEFINFYALVLESLGMSSHDSHKWQVVPGALLVLSLLILIGVIFKGHCKGLLEGDVAPPHQFSLVAFVEMILDFVFDLARSLIGDQFYRGFLPLMVGLFGFIFVSNLTGLVPGFPPPTESLNTNLAMGFTVFIVYNYQGFKEHGTHYIQQFLGPIWWMVPLILAIELIAHAARPLSLSLRLYGNIFGDHLVLSVFAGLTKGIFVVPLLFFGLLVASIQSFVFTLLTGIYISLAVSHDH